MTKQKAFVLSGIPGSGKTTLAKRLAEQTDAVLHSIDDLSNKLEKVDIDGRIRKQWMQNITSDLNTGKDVICDSLALNAISRKWILNELSAFPCEKILVMKVVPVEECIRRNAARIRKVSEDQIRLTARLLEPPTPEEGWDVLYISRE